MIKSNCNAHVIHNGKYGCKMVYYDVEVLVLKVWAEFLISAYNVDDLKEYSEYFYIEYSTLLRHVVTR